MAFRMPFKILDKYTASIFRADFYCYLYEDGSTVAMCLAIVMVRNKKLQR
jgi:hypothetical protein